MTLVIRVGLIAIAIVSIVLIETRFVVPLSVPCQTAVQWEETAPHGAIWEQEVIHWHRIPREYWTLVGWINAATVVPCADASAVAPRVEIRKIRIIERDRGGEESVVAEINPQESERFTGRLFPRVPRWFGETEGANEIDIETLADDRISLDLGQVPLRVYHGWTEPRIEIDPTRSYLLEVEANITPTARLQFGIDYWRTLKSPYAGWDKTCYRSNNCEAWVSDWYGDTQGEFKTFRAPTEELTPIAENSIR